MPKVSINWKKYLVQDFYEWMKGRMSSKNLRQDDVGKMIGVNQQSVSRKMLACKNGKPNFTQEEQSSSIATDEEILRLMKS